MGIGCLMAGLVMPCTAADKELTKQPLWEFGLGGGALAMSAYRGADTTATYLIPIPYFVYRGKFLRADRDGVRSVVFARDAIEININAGGTIPVSSRHVPARQGMPDLKPIFEIGPSVDWHVYETQDRGIRFDIRAPLRLGVSVSAAPRIVGLSFAPQFNVDWLSVGGHPGWDLGVLMGPLFSNRQYNQYFYTVAPQYARSDRPVYQAPGGYAGTQFLAAISKRFPNFWLGAYARYDSLHGTTFADSPLVRSKEYWALGIGFAWMVSYSSILVDNGAAP